MAEFIAHKEIVVKPGEIIEKSGVVRQSFQNQIIMLIHKEFDVPISYAQKAYDIMIEYLRLHAWMGDHPPKHRGPKDCIVVEKTENTAHWEEYNKEFCLWDPVKLKGVRCSHCKTDARLKMFVILSKTGSPIDKDSYELTKFCSHCGCRMIETSR